MAKQRMDIATLMKLKPIKLATVRRYLIRLQALKQEAFEHVTSALPAGSSLPQSAFDFLENKPSGPSEESLMRIRSCMIFDQLTNDFKLRKEAILAKLKEIGCRFTLTELLGLNLFVNEQLTSAAQP